LLQIPGFEPRQRQFISLCASAQFLCSDYLINLCAKYLKDDTDRAKTISRMEEFTSDLIPVDLLQELLSPFDDDKNTYREIVNNWLQGAQQNSGVYQLLKKCTN
jgi:hypothetical protein